MVICNCGPACYLTTHLMSVYDLHHNIYQGVIYVRIGCKNFRLVRKI